MVNPVTLIRFRVNSTLLIRFSKTFSWIIYTTNVKDMATLVCGFYRSAARGCQKWFMTFTVWPLEDVKVAHNIFVCAFSKS